ncbi:MAG: protein kinase [Planctomycetes bacterium]|nr:protein kinase [Planctomycetota bacterium]
MTTSPCLNGSPDACAASATHAASDHNLLFGLMALQMDFINRDELIASMKDWALEKNVPLGQILVRQRVLTEVRRGMIDALVADHVESNGGDTKKSLESLPVNNRVRADVANASDPVVQESIAHAMPQSPDDPGVTLTQAAVTAATPLRYRPLRTHAQGGLGQVYVAMDEELHREVALKEIKESHAANPESRARFILEAEVTGGLEHPGIVPVYGLGMYPDGRPYYAMRFIRGQSLKEAVDDFRAKVKAGMSECDRVLEWRQLLGRFIDVCNAIEYAHSRGVLHRDIKPSNIMLGKFGETLVVDWGLAKPIDQAEPPSSLEQEPLLKPSIVSTSAETIAGTALGTPAYMSPEQAEGRLDLLGPASDVFSLGATLYYLLTGRAPQEDRDIPTVLDRVRRGAFSPPRQVDRTIDPGLEAICLKAMAVEPKARYAASLELTQDIEHWLADEPVAAWREPWTVSAVRWIKKHRKFVTGLGAVLVLLLMIHVLVTQREVSLRLEADVARDDATIAMEQAKRNESKAQTLLYQAEMRRVFSFLDYADLNRADRVLERWLPTKDTPDLRNWEWHYLRQRCQGRLALAGHNGPATAIAYAPNGTRLASAGGEPKAPGEIKLWRTSDGQLERTLAGHRGRITSLAFSGDGKLLASASIDGIKIWAMPDGAELLTLTEHDGPVAAVAFSAKGMLASAGVDGTVRLRDSAGFSRKVAGVAKIVARHDQGAAAVAFSPDDSLLASAGRDGLVRLLDGSTGMERHVFRGHDGPVATLVFKAEGAVLASGGGRGPEKGEVFFWDVSTGELMFNRYGLSDRVVSLAYNPQGTLAIGSCDGQVRLFERKQSSESLVLRGDPEGLHALAFSPDGRHVACAGLTGRIFLANPSGGHEILWLPSPDPIEAIAFHPNSKIMACGGRTIQVWDLEESERPKFSLAVHGGVADLVFVLGGSQLAVASGDEVVRLYNAEKSDPNPVASFQHEAPVNVLDVTSDGKTLAAAGKERNIRVWDVASGTIVKSLDAGGQETLAVVFSADGRWLAAAGHDKIIRIWEWRTGAGFELTGHLESIQALAFHPHRAWLASGCTGGKVRIWDLESHNVVLKAETSSPILSLSFHAAGERLATAGQNQTVRLWGPNNGMEILELDYSASQLRDLAFSPDGRYLAAAGLNGCRVWDAGREKK